MSHTKSVTLLAFLGIFLSIKLLSFDGIGWILAYSWKASRCIVSNIENATEQTIVVAVTVYRICTTFFEKPYIIVWLKSFFCANMP